MGSDIGHSMYYTEAEPPVELIGKKRHFFAKPNSKAFSQGNASALRTEADNLNSNPTLPNEHITTQAQNAVAQLFSHKDVRDQLEQNFKSLDYA